MAKQKQFADIADVTPVFTVSQFTKALIYHFMFFTLCGPLWGFVMLLFEPLAFVQNVGFLPSSCKELPVVFYFVQMMNYSLWAVGLYFFLADLREGANSEDPESYQYLNPLCLIIAIT